MNAGPPDSLVPPDADPRQTGPMRLLAIGLAVTAAAYVAHGRLTPRASADVAVAPSSTPPTTVPAAVINRALRPRPAPVDSFFPSIGGPDESTADPFASASTKPPDAARPLRLQSIVVGPRRRVCMINDRPCVVGDAIEDAIVSSIGRASVVVRRAGHDVVIALPSARP